jgi:FAD/FMN-containing dehydrogenase
MKQPAIDGFYHPASAAEVRRLILDARRCSLNVRVRGSGHSVAASVRADRACPCSPARAGIDVMLDRMRTVDITPEDDGEHASVSVGAGCNIGLDPYDPSGTSTWENSLAARLHDAGWALDVTGGISHQTVAGFLMTGSAGGSIEHSFANAVVRLQFVDGTGEVHEVCRADGGERRRVFDAVGVSMGLLGIITKVWLRVRRTYSVAGRETTTPLANCAIDLFGDRRDRRPRIDEFLRTTPFSRILWWPQPGFDRVQVWSAEPQPIEPGVDAMPFEILGPAETLSGSLLQTIVGNLSDLSRVPQQLESLRWFSHLEAALARGEAAPGGRRRTRAKRARRIAEAVVHRAFARRLVNAAGAAAARRMPRCIRHLMKLYIQDGTKEFRDLWHRILPMDDNLDVQLWPASFAELWFPMDAAADVLNALRDIHRGTDLAERYRLSRAFPVEIYAGARSSFWLSPGYERESLRVNPVWLDQWMGDPVGDLYQSYFDALRPFGFRPHWGKRLPPASSEWRAYYRRHCPKLEDFLELQRRLDPQHIFLNAYWKAHLGIE